MTVKRFNQIALISAITEELNRQQPELPADDRMNVIIKAANDICAEYSRELVVASRGMGLTAWLASDDTGLSSKFMASVLSYGHFTAPNNYPRDPDDFGRCMRLVQAVPEFKGLIHLLVDHGPEWEAVANNWERWVELYSSGDGRELYKEMKASYAREAE
ncbi:hypothetical protein FH968_04320 [Buttiauxella sp. B2]|uniref:hypothetical protein n=1 Tax=Buttiauxella sp. B2 TaxID=2587812 RepID=UPI0011226F7E|nr:hypothetical protein [Buttiauxella sp. B2]TNV22107.1 hypothetical protein FH968_04320 [Buttiauxella sp. B2]